MPRFAEPQTWYRVRRIDMAITPTEVIGESEQYVFFAADKNWSRREHREAKKDSGGVIVKTVDEAVEYAERMIAREREIGLRMLATADEWEVKVRETAEKLREASDA